MSFIVILDADNSLLNRQKVNDCFFTLMAGFRGLWTAVITLEPKHENKSCCDRDSPKHRHLWFPDVGKIFDILVY